MNTIEQDKESYYGKLNAGIYKGKLYLCPWSFEDQFEKRKVIPLSFLAYFIFDLEAQTVLKTRLADVTFEEVHMFVGDLSVVDLEALSQQTRTPIAIARAGAIHEHQGVDAIAPF